MIEQPAFKNLVFVWKTLSFVLNDKTTKGIRKRDPWKIPLPRGEGGGDLVTWNIFHFFMLANNFDKQIFFEKYS